jgi:alpha-amylase
VALARGAHAKLADAPYTFSRVAAEDKVVVALGVSAPAVVVVTGVFGDGTRVRDAQSGAVATVTGGKVQITPHASGVVLLETAP